MQATPSCTWDVSALQIYCGIRCREPEPSIGLRSSPPEFFVEESINEHKNVRITTVHHTKFHMHRHDCIMSDIVYMTYITRHIPGLVFLQNIYLWFHINIRMKKKRKINIIHIIPRSEFRRKCCLKIKITRLFSKGVSQK